MGGLTSFELLVGQRWSVRRTLVEFGSPHGVVGELAIKVQALVFRIRPAYTAFLAMRELHLRK